MKGIILAGGTGSRLWPITLGISKQLLPIYDKPLIYHPISTFMLAGIREILIITTPSDKEIFQKILGDGANFGITLKFAIQEKPNGLAEAFIIGQNFVDNDPVSLILGDNIFHGAGLGAQLSFLTQPNGAQIFAYKVKDPERYGVIEFDSSGVVKSIEEKPDKPKSNFVVPGIYFYDNDVIAIANEIKPSPRGEIEITSINQEYLRQGRLQTNILPRGTTWLDTGTFETLNAASNYVKIIEERQGSKIACLEEIAWNNGWINTDQLLKLATGFNGNDYGNYLTNLALADK